MAGLFLLATSGAVHAATLVVPAGGDLQAALNRAQPGDEVVLEAGATFTGNFVLPVKSGASFVTVRSARSGELPAGVRVKPADAPKMARLATANVMPALTAPVGSSYYRFVGVEFVSTVNYTYDVISLGDGDTAGAQNSPDKAPHHLEFDRCMVRPSSAGLQLKNGVSLNSALTSVTNSHISGVKWAGIETHALVGWNGPGPFTIENNYLEAAGINILFGGAKPATPNLIPSDIRIRHNHFYKPLEWRGVYTVKNLFELKNARRVNVTGNLFEHNWADAQVGYAILFTPRPNDSGDAAVVEDVNFSHNVVRRVAAAFNLIGTDTLYERAPAEVRGRRIKIHHNLLTEVGAFGGDGVFLKINNGADQVSFDHNTVLHAGNITKAGGAGMTLFSFTNNLMAHNEYGVHGDGAGIGLGGIQLYFPGSTWARNVIAGAPESRYPTNNFYPPSLADVVFTDPAAGHYRLAASSPYKGRATDGKDVGCDFSALEAEMAGNGTPSAIPTPPPTPLRFDDPEDFATQHYRDFLGREPDPSGLHFWAGEVASCGADARCAEVKRVNVSAAFFLSIEFQETGYLAYRMYQAGLRRRPLFVEFTPDMRKIREEVVVGVGDWQARLETNKRAFAEEFVTRFEFRARYPESLSPAHYVELLNENTGGALSPAERVALVAGLTSGAETRASVLRKVAEDRDFRAAQQNRAFVIMQYFGYLRRDPDDAGFNFWLAKLEEHRGNFLVAEMVRAFISSIEYRRRFAQI